MLDLKKEEFPVANYLLSLECQAMLKVVLQNQAIIMKHLGLPIELNSATLATVMPDQYKPQNANLAVAKMLSLTPVLSRNGHINVAEAVFAITRLKKEVEILGPDLGMLDEDDDD